MISDEKQEEDNQFSSTVSHNKNKHRAVIRAVIRAVVFRSGQAPAEIILHEPEVLGRWAERFDQGSERDLTEAGITAFRHCCQGNQDI